MSPSRSSRSERSASIPVPDSDTAHRVLEGLFVPSDDDRGAAVVAPPHPQYGGSMENPVVGEIADACQRVGLASIRFNWRGVGASAGAPTGELDIASADYAAALAFAQESSRGPIAACGYSFGAALAATAVEGHERAKRLLLVAPPVLMLNRAALKAFPGRILLVAGDRDEYAPQGELEALAGEFDNAEFVLLAGTDHYFTTGLSELGRVAESFLARTA